MVFMSNIEVGQIVNMNQIIEVQGEVLSKTDTTLTTAGGTYTDVDLFEVPVPPTPDTDVIVFSCEQNATQIYSISRNYLLQLHAIGTLEGAEKPYLQTLYNLCDSSYIVLLVKLAII